MAAVKTYLMSHLWSYTDAKDAKKLLLRDKSQDESIDFKVINDLT